MTHRLLRIVHNGHVLQGNPHWHLKIWNDGVIRGEIIGPRSNFKAIQRIEQQINEADITTLLAEAVTMSTHFQPREKMYLPDDVMVELNENTDGKVKTLFLYAIPLEDQYRPEVSAFLKIVNRIFEPYV